MEPVYRSPGPSSIDIALRAIVRLRSGKTVEIGIDRLSEFVTEKENPENEKQVSLVEVELASPGIFDGIRFVDTPGLGSIFSHNTQASMDWLPHVGGALVAVSVNHPFSGLSSQWAEAVNGSIDLLVRQAMEFVSGELATIGRLVAGAGDNRDRIRQSLPVNDPKGWIRSTPAPWMP